MTRCHADLVGFCFLLGAGGGFLLGWLFQLTQAADQVLWWMMNHSLVEGDVQISWAALGLQIGAAVGLMAAAAILAFCASSDGQ